ncbi:unnamed protein product [Coregonus sp. 'balchen']|nr:unnamed protein product [Coregonus sp. 'balchen']
MCMLSRGSWRRLFLYELALDIREKSFGPKHPTMMGTLRKLPSSTSKTGRSEAEPSLVCGKAPSRHSSSGDTFSLRGPAPLPHAPR